MKKMQPSIETAINFSIFRKNMQIFEIFKPYYGRGTVIKKFVFDDSLKAPSWTIVKSVATGPINTIVDGKEVTYKFVGAALQAEGKTVPIVQFLKNVKIPTTIRGVRVTYGNGFDAAFFGKKFTYSVGSFETGRKFEVTTDKKISIAKPKAAAPKPKLTRPKIPKELKESNPIVEYNDIGVGAGAGTHAYEEEEDDAHDDTIDSCIKIGTFFTFFLLFINLIVLNNKKLYLPRVYQGTDFDIPFTPDLDLDLDLEYIPNDEHILNAGFDTSHIYTFLSDPCYFL
jgi:hypothetical protein